MDPQVPAPEAQFRRFLADGRFMLQRSRTSGRHVFPPRVAEPGTGSRELEWVPASGRGTLHAITIVPRKPPQPAHCIVLVDLAEGPRMLATLVSVAPETVAIGAALTARLDREGSEPLVVFEVAAG
jgi:hypothetical protein